MKDASMEVGNASMGTVHCPKLPIEMPQSTDPRLSGMISTNQPDLYWEYTLRPCNLRYQTNRVLVGDSSVTPWDAPVTSRDSTTTYLYITFIMSYHFFRVGTLFLPDLMFISTIFGVISYLPDFIFQQHHRCVFCFGSPRCRVWRWYPTIPAGPNYLHVERRLDPRITSNSPAWHISIGWALG